MESGNPFAAPAARLEDVSRPKPDPIADTEEIRRAHLTHESLICVVGLFDIFCGALCVALSLTAPVFLWVDGAPLLPVMLVSGGYLTVGVILCWLGYGLRKLSPSSLGPAGIVHGLGALFPPLTILNLLALYVLFSRKGRRILSPSYRDIMEQTPAVVYRASMSVKVGIAVAIALVFALIGIAIALAR